MVSAFRIMPIKPSQCFLLVMKAQHPVTWKIFYFIDKYLPFGSSISCAVFQSFSDALAFLFEHKKGFVITVANYLDDFLLMAYTVTECNKLMSQFLLLCNKVECPVSQEKTEWASSLMTILGMLLNGAKRICDHSRQLS